MAQIDINALVGKIFVIRKLIQIYNFDSITSLKKNESKTEIYKDIYNDEMTTKKTRSISNV